MGWEENGTSRHSACNLEGIFGARTLPQRHWASWYLRPPLHQQFQHPRWWPELNRNWNLPCCLNSWSFLQAQRSCHIRRPSAVDPTDWGYSRAELAEHSNLLHWSDWLAGHTSRWVEKVVLLRVRLREMRRRDSHTENAGDGLPERQRGMQRSR